MERSYSPIVDVLSWAHKDTFVEHPAIGLQLRLKKRDCGGEFVHFVALSTADSNKWLLLKEGHLEKRAPEVITSSDYRLNGPISQRQRRLTGAQVAEMATKYQAGATVYELAAEFGCHRATVAERLKKAGIMMRGQSPNPEEIDSMARLVASGLSPEAVGKQLGFCANTVRNCLRGRHSMQ